MADGSSYWQRCRDGLFQPRGLCLAAAFILVATFAPEVVRRLPDLRDRPEYRLTAELIDVTQPPAWVPKEWVTQAWTRADLPDSLSALDSETPRRLFDALADHPWVAEVARVELRGTGRARVTVRYRQPVALIEVKGGVFPVDAEAVLLPSEDFTLEAVSDYPLIQGVWSLPKGPAGTPWGDAIVRDAVALAGALGPHWKPLGLKSIVCPRPTADRQPAASPVFMLLSTGGSQILWGRAPNTSHAGELTLDQKLGRLKKYVADFGGFEKPSGPYRIDIRHWQEISRKPLAAYNERSASR